MKGKYTSLVGILAVLVLIASFIVPAKLLTPDAANAAASDMSKMQWWPVITPDTEWPSVRQLYTPILDTLVEGGSEITKLLVGNDGNTMYALISQPAIVSYATAPAPTTRSMLRIRKSANGGISWSSAIYADLMEYVTGSNAATTADVLCWDMAIAPDSPAIVTVAVTDLNTTAVNNSRGVNEFSVYISQDGGTNWDNTQWPPTAIGVAGKYISTMDISMDFGGRYVLVGTRDGVGANTNNISTMKIPGFGGWNVLNTAGTPASIGNISGDIIVAKFSPTYNGDATIAVVYSDNLTGDSSLGATYLATGIMDVARNSITWQDMGSQVELRNSGTAAGSSPREDEIITADLELPSDFSGQSASLRRFYVSTDATTRTAGFPNRGVYRVDDTTLYTLMDNSTTFALQSADKPTRRVASIAYWGTYASGKLMVGERLGVTCKAAVPVWFTDSPTVCPVPCWYPSKKPPSGAAGDDCIAPTCTPRWGFGNADVAWSPTFAAQGVGYAVTGSSSFDGAFATFDAQTAALTWPAAKFNLVPLDESAFSLTRNNGETWNQLALIDTRMNKLTDVAPSADCTTIYLASVNNSCYCSGFDSVWRTSINEKVVAPPLPVLPIGSVWERVRVSVTANNCTNAQSNYAIIRLAPDKLDGQVVGWAAGGSNGAVIGGFATGANKKVMAWSPDFGDYWADITPRLAVQDFAFANTSTLYVVSTGGSIQKMPYTGTAWASTVNTVDLPIVGGHTIEATYGTWGLAEDKVIVGNNVPAGTPYVAAVSLNGGTSFVPMTRTVYTPATTGYHVLMDTDFAKNSTIYAASDQASAGLVYRNKAPAGSSVEWTDMMTGARFVNYTGPHVEYYGLAQANSKNVTGEGTLYAAHDANQASFSWIGTGTEPADSYWSGVERTLTPLIGIPKPHMDWSCLDAAWRPFQTSYDAVGDFGPLFTLEPKSLKLCGCLTQDTWTSLYAIDNDTYSNYHNLKRAVVSNMFKRGLLWEYTDCVAKVGPKLTMDDGTIIGCDPATGRNQEVNFTWEQLCIANQYNMMISKDKAMTKVVWGLVNDVPLVIYPASVTSPALVYLAGGEGTSPEALLTMTPTGGTAVFVKPATPSLECGHTYFWWVRVYNEVTNDYVISPWSDVRGFTIKAGFRVTTPYYGPQLLAPDNGCGCACAAPVCFSWSPFKETTEYKFEMSENADMSSPLISTAVKTTAYQYTGAVKCNKNYFWRVMSVKPAPSEWSAVFSFMTQPEPAKPPAEKAPVEPATPFWVWVVIAIGAILVIVTLVLIFKTRRV